ncbi:MAG: MarR family transcriptional regulator [Bacteroidetes bacterium]|nr:MarR family transcriptional regulator [Bacteroidota bacterium]
MKLEEEISQKHFRNEYHKAAVNVVYTFNWLNNHNVSFFKPLGITPQQFNILRILRGQHPNPATIKLIKERMLDKMSDASRIVEKLRVKGLVERNICSHDRRNVDVCITQKGLDLLSQIDMRNDEADQKFSALNPEEIKQLNDLLDKLRG